MTVNATAQPLRDFTSCVTLTLTRASYHPHASAAVVFGASGMCRNISRVACVQSGAQRKDCTVTGGSQEVRHTNLVTLHRRQPVSTQNCVPKVTTFVCSC